LASRLSASSLISDVETVSGVRTMAVYLSSTR
jgi:hypothetical protein